ncbi:MAG: hypothetical protein AMS24_00315 [Chlamydiae bacterium SM23_39]|nr:MAG: hypothetical protein AMS24_00315 [Chlamydiae bacterium SM23_39]
MEIQSIKIKDQQINNISNIESIWVYMIFLLKMVLDTDRKKENSIAKDSEILYTQFEDNKKKWEKINEEIDKLNQRKKLTPKERDRLQELKGEQNICSLKAQDLQNQMRVLWQVKMNSIYSDEYRSMQTGYKVIDDMLSNNPSFRKLR